MQVHDASQLFFAGIGGVGMSGLAQLLVAEGKTVLGSDLNENELTRRLSGSGVTVHIGEQRPGQIPEQTELFVYSAALPDDHPQRVAATERGIPTLSYFEAVGSFMEAFDHTIAISGTHGKSTTTAMIAEVLVAAGLDPTVLVGTIVPSLRSNARAGGRSIFVVEACEHKEHMLQLKPSTIVLTNIEEDHLDHYRDLEHIVMTFQKYVNHLPSDGMLVKNVDDSEVEELGFDGTAISYGIENDAQVQAVDVHVAQGEQRFQVDGQQFALQIPGVFNVYNALAALAVARSLGVSDADTAPALSDFTGVWRRFERVGAMHGAQVVVDYAHHPTAIHSTIKAARSFYPGKRMVVAFQPHQRSRTVELFDGFVSSLAEADFVIVQEIYDVVGREEGQHISGRDIVEAVGTAGKYAQYTANADETVDALRETVDVDDVILIMGAGDIYTIAEQITD